jgi:hypothetical protein
MLPIAPAGAPRIVNRADVHDLAQFMAAAPQAPTKINVFIIEKIILVEASDPAKSG